MAQLQVVAWFDISVWPSFHTVALFHAIRCKDVAFIPIRIVQQCNARGAVGVVFNMSDFRRYTVFIGPAEVNHAVRAFVTSPNVPSGDPARRVTPPSLG